MIKVWCILLLNAVQKLLTCTKLGQNKITEKSWKGLRLVERFVHIIDFLVKMSPQKTLSSIICWFFGTNRKTNIHICVCICGDEIQTVRQIRMFVFVLEMETHALMSYSKTNMRVCVCLYGDGNTRIDVLQ